MSLDERLSPKTSAGTKATASGAVSRRTLIAGAVGVTGAVALGAMWRSVTGGSGPTVASSYPLPVLKEIALELVSTAENTTKVWRSSYAYIQDIDDGRGYTGGVVGWCSGTGDMLALVQRYTSNAPGNPLEGFIPALEQIMEAPYASRPALSHTLLDPKFTTAWATAARTPQFQAAQRSERDRVYWNPALAAARRDGLSPLGIYLYFDILVNHGPDNNPESFGGIVAGVKARGQASPAQGGDEIAYLRAIIAARDTVLKDWGMYQVDGRSTIGLKFLAAKNLGLILPLTWTVYGDSYSIITPPAP